MYDSKRTRVAVSVVRLVAAGMLEDRALGLAKCTWGRGKQPNVVRHLRGSCDAKLCAPARAMICVGLGHCEEGSERARRSTEKKWPTLGLGSPVSLGRRTDGVLVGVAGCRA